MSALPRCCRAALLGTTLACALSAVCAGELANESAPALATFRARLAVNDRPPPAACRRVDAQTPAEELSVAGLSADAASWMRQLHAETRGLSTSCFTALDDEFQDATWRTPCVLKRDGPPRNGSLFFDLDAKAAAVEQAYRDPACALARDALAPGLRTACAADAAWELANVLKACTFSVGGSEYPAAPEWEDLWSAWLPRQCVAMPLALREATYYWRCDGASHCPLPPPPPPHLHPRQLADWAARRGSHGAMSCYNRIAAGLRSDFAHQARHARFRPEFFRQLQAAWDANDDELEAELLDDYYSKGLLATDEADREYDRMYQDARSVLEQMAAVDPASALAQLAFFEIRQRPDIDFMLQWRLPKSNRVRRQQRSLVYLLAAEMMDDGRLLDNLREQRWERLAYFHLLTPDNVPAARRAAKQIVAKVRNGQRPEL